MRPASRIFSFSRAGSRLLYSGIDDERFSIVFAVKEDRVDDETLERIVELYQASDAIKTAVHSAYASNENLYMLIWQE